MDKSATQIQESYISEADFFAHYEGHYEWLDGKVIAIAPANDTHAALFLYLGDLLRAYLIFQPIAQIRFDPFTMRLKDLKRNRQPDIQLILNSNPNELTATYMDGAANICIEIVSPASVETDKVIKFKEYQAAGVQEYWIIDPTNEEAFFYRLDAKGVYQAQAPEKGIYRSPQLPKFELTIETLWAYDLPNMFEVLELVKKMFEE